MAELGARQGRLAIARQKEDNFAGGVGSLACDAATMIEKTEFKKESDAPPPPTPRPLPR